jgi:hypothetical protein
LRGSSLHRLGARDASSFAEPKQFQPEFIKQPYRFQFRVQIGAREWIYPQERNAGCSLQPEAGWHGAGFYNATIGSVGPAQAGNVAAPDLACSTFIGDPLAQVVRWDHACSPEQRSPTRSKFPQCDPEFKCTLRDMRS